jgi:Winged helix DNA-binding domain
MAHLDSREIAEWRTRNLRLDGAPLPTAREVVACLVAVQSQDYGPAMWSVGQRSTRLTQADVQRAYAEGEILRTHVLRPTWHFVAPADIRWLLALTRPRVHALTSFGRRRDELDAQTFRQAHGIFENALQGGHQLTRNDLGARLREHGLEATGTRLAHILIHAELEGLICSGAPRGKQHTYALLEERVSPARQLTRDEALVELTSRYFTSHGPASAKDFQWWSSLSLAEVRRGVELASSQLQSDTLDGVTYWFGELAEPCRSRRRVHLLQMFDEYLVGYSQTRAALDRAGATSSLFSTINVRSGALILDTQLAGTWRRNIGKDGLSIETRLREAFDPEQRQALQAEVDRHAAFLDLPASLRVEV